MRIIECCQCTEKPRIIEGPKDVVVQENLDVSFVCRATGDPEPTIIWKKSEDQMPQGRSEIGFFAKLIVVSHVCQ